MRKTCPVMMQAKRNIGTPSITVAMAPYATGALATPRRTVTLLRLNENEAKRATSAPSMGASVLVCGC